MNSLHLFSVYQQGLDALADSEPHFASILDRHGVPPLWDRPNTFRSLVHIVLEQQVSLASAKAVLGRLDAQCSLETHHGVLVLGEGGLRLLGVTRQKAHYIMNVALAMESGALDLAHLATLPDKEVVAALTKIKGIGQWTANIYLLMILLRTDVWPRGDLALANSMNHVFGVSVKSTDAAFMEMAEAWRPWRAVAARLLWHHYLSDDYE